ncbi:MAG: hypothetical protein J7L11_02835 [Thermoprotei archaeon]|nr:hypothetical protein [Thermoprotei archaeon]
MITYSDIMRIYKKIRAMNAKAFFTLKGTRYRLVIDRYIHARDPEDRRVSWTQAFGSKLPHDVLNTYEVVNVRILSKERELDFKDLKEFLKWIS